MSRLLLLPVLALLLMLGNSRILENIYSESAELKQLSKQQAEFERQFELIKKDLGEATTQFKAADRPKRIEAMERTIHRHRSMLLEASKQLIPPLNLSLCDCAALSQTEKQHIINALNEVRTSIFELQGSLKKATPCARTRQMQQDLQAQLFIADKIEEVLDSKCKRAAVLTPTIWQTNLGAPNWILGEQTLDDVVDDYYERSVKYDNITNCNINEPYFNGTSCISCPKEQPLFNLYTMRCTQCDQGYEFSNSLKNCGQATKAAAVAPSLKCKENQFLVESTGTCVELVKCGLGTILDRESNTCRIKHCQQGSQLNKQSGECEKINCRSDFFNAQTNQCEHYRHCDNSYLNRELNKCESYLFCNPESQFLDKTKNLCVTLSSCTSQQFLDQTTNKCVERVKCNSDSYYNSKQNLCEPRLKCSEREFYEGEFNRCVPFVDCSDRFLNRNLNRCEDYKVCDKEDIVLNRNTNECEKVKDCGNDKYFNRDTLECEGFVACPSDRYLNRRSNVCEMFISCPTNFLDKSRNECVDWATCGPEVWLNRVTNQCDKRVTCADKFYNGEKNVCEEYQKCEGVFLDRKTNTCHKFRTCESRFLDRETNLCVDIVKCDTDKQFYNGTTNRCDPYRECSNFLDRTINGCLDYVQCSDKEQLNKTSNKCVEKEVTCYPDEVFNVDTGKCVKRPVIYRPIENLTRYVEGKSSLARYLDTIKGGIEKNPNARVETCPESQPYSLLTECTACPGGLFFLDTLSCHTCKEGYEYDQKMKSCRIRLYLNNPQGKLDLHGLTPQEFKDHQQKIVRKNLKAVLHTCPIEQPYSKQGMSCMSCPENAPIFDVVQSQCKACPSDQQYSEQKRACL